MAGVMLKIDIRRGKILERLKRDGAVSVAQLATELGATPVTIRSDLDALEKDGYLLRVQGGAVRKGGEPDTALSRQGETVQNQEEKLAIAKAISRLIRDGDTLFINSGTTMEAVAACLKNHKNLNVVTNGVKVAQELGRAPTCRVILLGGEINAQYGFTYGSDAQAQIRQYQADWALVTLNGISAKGGMTTYHAEEATLNCMMLAQAKKVMVAADHSKVGRAGFFRFSEIGDGIQLMTDTKADRAATEELAARGVKVEFAGE